MPSGGKKDKRGRKGKKGKPLSEFFANIFSLMTDLYSLETQSRTGRINLVGTTLLAVIIIVYLLSSTPTALARIIASIWKDGVENQSGDNIVGLLLIFACSFFLCFIIVCIADKEQQKIEDKEKD